MYILNLFPNSQQEVPNDMLEAWHRSRDIMYTDKTASNVRTSKIISKHLSLLKDMHEYIMSSTSQSPNRLNNEKLVTIEEEYDKLAHQRGAVIQDIVRIERTEDSRFLFEDADFSFETIKKLICAYVVSVSATNEASYIGNHIIKSVSIFCLPTRPRCFGGTGVSFNEI